MNAQTTSAPALLGALLISAISLACPRAPNRGESGPARECGDGVLEASETCDDANTLAGDGCGASCLVEAGWTCAGAPSICSAICGDGRVRGREGCDEGGTLPTNGCSLGCTPRPGFACAGEGPGSCRAVCGDGRVRGGETCDDGNVSTDDGCSSTCLLEGGFRCDAGEPTVCTAICGDGHRVGSETCDDGNLRDGDGCSSMCVSRVRWRPLPNATPPESRFDAVAVWTGEEMFFWGGWAGGLVLGDGRLYDPRSRTWRAIDPAGAPSARASAATTWTGAEVVVWGGETAFRSVGNGALYDPSAGRWRKMSDQNAPSSRAHATASWTGSEVIILGGEPVHPDEPPSSSHAAYDPSTDTWRALASEGAPSQRTGHTAVWTGTELIVFGGRSRSVWGLGDGTAYDPVSNRWRPLPDDGAPSPRSGHAAVWTGSEMIVYGGCGPYGVLSDGAAYDPVANAWRPIAPNRPSEGGCDQVAAWTGDALVIWGGLPLGRRGKKYVPAVDAWFDLPMRDEPSVRAKAAGLVTPLGLLVFGGYRTNAFQSREPAPGGGLLDLETETWHPIESSLPIELCSTCSAAHAGSELIFWATERDFSNNDYASGYRIDVNLGTWRRLPTEGAPSSRTEHSTLTTDREVIIWGGTVHTDTTSEALNDGASYDLAEDRWTPLPRAGAPSPRGEYTAVIAGSEMIVWGGYKDGFVVDGARFDLEARVWRPMASGPDAPAPRANHVAVWTGSEMIVWGGESTNAFLSSGARYDPERDRWTPMSLEGAPEAGFGVTAVWTGSEMIVWGGYDWFRDPKVVLGTGGRYDPKRDRWTPLPLEGAPEARSWHTATWTGAQMVVFGGAKDALTPELAGDGARYDPAIDRWLPLPREHAPAPRMGHFAFWMGSSLVIWGGSDTTTALANGALLDL